MYQDYTDFKHPAHSGIGIKEFPGKLYVVTTIFNPQRWRSRYKLFNQFEKMCLFSSSDLYIGEAAFGWRHHEISTVEDSHHIQFRTHDELWHKENILNIVISRLPTDWKYVAWVDADVRFQRSDWAEETLHLLQHYQIIQMFSFAQNLGPNYEPLGLPVPGFVYKYHEHTPLSGPNLEELFHNNKNHYPYYPPGGQKRGPWAHPGFAWAARREAFDNLGGLLDTAIVGSADWHMCCALIGQAKRSVSFDYSKGYTDCVLEWQSRAEKHIRRNIGFMPGLLTHFWHGKLSQRMYNARWKLLVQCKFNPLTDLKRNSQGLWQLIDRGDERFIRLRDGLKEYGKLRNEDSIDL